MEFLDQYLWLNQLKMCGRFISIAKKNKIKKIFNVKKENNFSEESYNISPSKKINVLYYKDGELILDSLKWGYSFFSKFNEKNQLVINSRLETINSKLIFKDSYLKRKCIIIANGYFEWKRVNEKKQPYFINIPEQELFYFAGIWRGEDFNDKKQTVCCIITKNANKKIERIHNRMPVIFSLNEALTYLEDKSNNYISSLLESEIEKELDFYKISNKINNPKNNYKECLNPIN